MQTGFENAKSVDVLGLLLYLALICFGIACAYAVDYSGTSSDLFNFSTQHGKQMIWGSIGLTLGGVILLFDSKFFSTFAFPSYFLILILLIFTFLFAPEFKGAKSWFELGPIKIQPSEFAKFTCCLALAKFASLPSVNMQDLKTQLISIGIFLLPMALIILQGDFGTALVFIGLILVIYRFGMSFIFPGLGLLLGIIFILTLAFSWQAVLIGIAAILVLPMIAWIRKFKQNKSKVFISLAFTAVIYVFSAHVIPLVFEGILKPHQRTRILVLLGKEVSEGANYNVMQSKIAIGSGGLTGKGYLDGSLTKGQFVPEQSTDFIFSTIGEEFGFIGTSIFILIFAAFIVRIFILAERQRSLFSKVYGYGAGIIFFMHFSLNIAMTIGLFPVVGIPLPFISYGGSSLLGFSILFFILLKLDRNRSTNFR